MSIVVFVVAYTGVVVFTYRVYLAYRARRNLDRADRLARAAYDAEKRRR